VEEKIMVMKDKRESNSQRVKKPYQKPEIRKIQLRPEEAVLGFCKNTGYFGPGSSDCGFGTCFSSGS
jgi:hypothetical protein